MNIAVNPIVGTFRTSDDRWINLTMLQPGRYLADVCRHLGLEHLIDDERFDTAEALMANADEAGRDSSPRRSRPKPYAYWVERLADHGRAVGAGAEPARARRRSADRAPTATSLDVVDADGNDRRAGGEPGAVRRDAAHASRGRRSSPSTPTRSSASSDDPRTRSSS